MADEDENEEIPRGSYSYIDALSEVERLPATEKRKIEKQKAGCDYLGSNADGHSTECHNIGTHAVFAFKQTAPLVPDSTSPTGKTYAWDTTEPRPAIAPHDVKIYCPHHAEEAFKDLDSQVANQTENDIRSKASITEAAKIPLHKVDALASHPENRHLAQHLQLGIAYNALRHSGKIKSPLPPKGFPQIKAQEESSKEDALGDLMEEQYGARSFIEADLGAPIGEAIHAEIFPEAKPKSFKNMDRAHEVVIQEPEEKKRTEEENKRVRTRLSKARAADHNWCSNCEKSTKFDPICSSCSDITTPAKEVVSRPAGRPFQTEKATVKFENNKKIQVDTATVTMRSVDKAVKGLDEFSKFFKGEAPLTPGASIQGAPEKPPIARTHYAPMEAYGQSDQVPSLSNIPETYGQNSWVRAMYRAPDPNTGPATDRGISTTAKFDSETGAYKPVLAIQNGQQVATEEGTLQLDTGADSRLDVRSRTREVGLNVKKGHNIAPSTTCHECTLQKEKHPLIRSIVKNSQGIPEGVCAKGHRVPTTDIPVAWDEKNGMAMHVYPRKTGQFTSQQKPKYDWILTDEPAIFKSGVVPTLKNLTEFTSYREHQTNLEKPANPVVNQNRLLVKKLSQMHAEKEALANLPSDTPTEQKETNMKRRALKASLSQGVSEAQNGSTRG